MGLVAARQFCGLIGVACLLAVLGAAACSAGDLAISVVDSSGRGVGDVVVTVAPVAPVAPVGPHGSQSISGTAVMDQLQRQFVPRVLVIPVGTVVTFPNNDTVSHQVYSFSPAKKFQLPLYRGQGHSPVTFEQKGLVVLGCNIHDAMVGYIYVTDAPFFGKTSAAGTLDLQALAAGDYEVTVWSPFIADPPPTLTRRVHVDAREASASRLQLMRSLRDRPEPQPRRNDWEY